MKFESLHPIHALFAALTSAFLLAPNVVFGDPNYSISDEDGVITFSPDFLSIVNDTSMQGPGGYFGGDSRTYTGQMNSGYSFSSFVLLSGYAEPGEPGTLDAFKFFSSTYGGPFSPPFPASYTILTLADPSTLGPFDPGPTRVSSGGVIDYITFADQSYPLYFYDTTPTVADNRASSLGLLGMALVALYAMRRLNHIRVA